LLHVDHVLPCAIAIFSPMSPSLHLSYLLLASFQRMPPAPQSFPCAMRNLSGNLDSPICTLCLCQAAGSHSSWSNFQIASSLQEPQRPPDRVLALGRESSNAEYLNIRILVMFNRDDAGGSQGTPISASIGVAWSPGGTRIDLFRLPLSVLSPVAASASFCVYGSAFRARSLQASLVSLSFPVTVSDGTNLRLWFFPFLCWTKLCSPSNHLAHSTQ